MKLDYHAAILALREGYARYHPLAEKAGTAGRLEAAQALLESLPADALALEAVQNAVRELVPAADEASRRWRGNVLSFLVSVGAPLADRVTDDLCCSAHR